MSRELGRSPDDLFALLPCKPDRKCVYRMVWLWYEGGSTLIFLIVHMVVALGLLVCRRCKRADVLWLLSSKSYGEVHQGFVRPIQSRLLRHHHNWQVTLVSNQVYHDLSQRRTIKRVSVDVLQLKAWYGLFFNVLRKDRVHSFVLKGRNDVSVTEQPDFDENTPAKISAVSIAELVSVYKVVEDLENINLLLWRSQSALGSFLERAAESAAKVVGIVDEKILVDHEGYLFDTDFDRHDALIAVATKSEWYRLCEFWIRRATHLSGFLDTRDTAVVATFGNFLCGLFKLFSFTVLGADMMIQSSWR